VLKAVVGRLKQPAGEPTATAGEEVVSEDMS
jgi:hypothetical protein